jgi:hypothetical protein
MLNDRKIITNGKNVRIWEETVITNSISNNNKNYGKICRITSNIFET